ncbi:replicative DNA helicase [Pelomonas sp. HMWF004]|nr:replicative DNA helicase [Pelomonas sp. HMWF004]
MSAVFDPRPEPGAEDVEVAGLRMPPHSVEAEQGVLGGLLIDNRAWDKVGDLLKGVDFYRHEHRLMYAAIGRLVNAGKPADVVTVFDVLDEAQRAAVGGLTYLNSVAHSVPSASNMRRYAEIVRACSVQRQVAALAMDLQGAVQGRMETPEIMAAVDGAVTALLGLMSGQQEREPQLLEDLLGPWLDELEQMAEGKVVTFPTGLTALDELTGGGGRRGETWVLGARPSMGKSAAALTLALNISGRETALVLSQEDSVNMLLSRMVAHTGRVNLAVLRNPYRAEQRGEMAQAWGPIAEAVDALRPRKLYVDGQTGLTLQDVRRKIQQVRRRDPSLSLVVVDYLQLMTGNEGDNRNQMLGVIANGLNKVASDLGVWILLLSQLSRKADEHQGVPQMHHLRDSGDIEGAGHVIVLLHREHMRNKEAPKDWAQMHVAKQKNGATDTINVRFDGAFQRFSDWDGPTPVVGKGKAGGGLN